MSARIGAPPCSRSRAPAVAAERVEVLEASNNDLDDLAPHELAAPREGNGSREGQGARNHVVRAARQEITLQNPAPSDLFVTPPPGLTR